MGGSKKKKQIMNGNLSRKLKYDYDDDDLDYFGDGDGDVYNDDDFTSEEYEHTNEVIFDEPKNLDKEFEKMNLAQQIANQISPFRDSEKEFPSMGIVSTPFSNNGWNIWNSKLLVDAEKGLPGPPPGFENVVPIEVDKDGCSRPKFKARYKCEAENGFESEHKPNYTWEPARWVICEKCGMHHSNREIPKGYMTSGNWKVRKGPRKKVGIILVRNHKEVWMIQSYGNCFGFPKGEKEDNETEAECAVREFREETGWNLNVDLKKSKYLTHKIENILYMFYVVHVGREFDITTLPEDDVEITTFGWCKLTEIPNLKLSKVGRVIFRKWQSSLNYKTNKFKSNGFTRGNNYKLVPNGFKAFEKKRKFKQFEPKIIHQPTY